MLLREAATLGRFKTKTLEERRIRELAEKELRHIGMTARGVPRFEEYAVSRGDKILTHKRRIEGPLTEKEAEESVKRAQELLQLIHGLQAERKALSGVATSEQQRAAAAAKLAENYKRLNQVLLGK